VRVHEAGERGLTGQAFRHLKIGGLAGKTRNAAGGIGEECEAGFEFIAGVNAVG
jgi:hypothetical protein